MTHYTLQQCYDYWTKEVNEKGNPNRPIFYSVKPKGIIDYLYNFWNSYVSKEDIILEPGCNCAVNLHWLYTLGYKNLQGIEINCSAIEEMKKRFPEYNNFKIYKGALEDILPTIESKSIDVIFTMAVLEHVHTSKTEAFKEMVRVAKKYIITVEDEDTNQYAMFARKYNKIFENFGCKEIKSHKFDIEETPYINKEYDGYTMRLFKIEN